MLKVKQLQLTKVITPDFWTSDNVLTITKQNGDEIIEEVYSPNLIEGDLCYKIEINSLPSNTIMINDNEINIIRIGASGIFNMDFGNNPIQSIRVSQNNKYNPYDMYIDLVCLSAKKDA